jgi:hypothetical protein
MRGVAKFGAFLQLEESQNETNKQMKDTFFVPLQHTSSKFSSDITKFERNITKIL